MFPGCYLYQCTSFYFSQENCGIAGNGILDLIPGPQDPQDKLEHSGSVYLQENTLREGRLKGKYRDVFSALSELLRNVRENSL